MGSVANKIAEKIVSHRSSRTFDLARVHEDQEMLASVTEHDPCFALYAFAQNFASLAAEHISSMSEARGFVRIVGAAEDEYLPSGPPMSPLTNSYFTMWSMFDVRFGRSRETMGSCILRVAEEFDTPAWLMEAVERMQQSRMGFFVHCGSDGGLVQLREVGKQETVSCSVPAGYAGIVGEIWFVRVFPPDGRSCNHHIVFNTPYVVRDYPESAFIDYLARELARMKGKKSSRADDAHNFLMKYGPDPNHWNEYIFCAYTGHQREAVFLTGIPDIPDSLPHG